MVLTAGVALSAGCQQQPVTYQSEAASSLVLGRPVVRRDIQVNTHTRSAQGATAVAAHPDGGSIVVWHSRRQDNGQYGVYGRRVSATGQLLTPAVKLSDDVVRGRFDPAVAALRDGAIWIAWEAHAQDGDRGSIVARRFDNELTPLGPEFLVNKIAAGNQTGPVIQVSANQVVTIGWISTVDDLSDHAVVIRQFDNRGQPTGPQRRIDGGLPAIRSDVTIADRAGAVVAAWHRIVSRNQSVVEGVRFVQDGHIEPFRVANGPGMNIQASVATYDDGWVVAWLVAESNGYAVHVQRWSEEGHSPAMALPSRRGSAATSPTSVGVVARPDGFHAVMWGDYQPQCRGNQLVVQVFDGAGDAVTAVLPLTQTHNNNQYATTTGSGIGYWNESGLTVAWAGDAGAGDNSSAAITRWLSADYSDPPEQLAQADVESLESAAPHEPPEFSPTSKTGGDLMICDDGGISSDFGFPAIGFTGWNPPDPHIAVGMNHIVQVVNGRIAFFQKDGTLDDWSMLFGPSGFWSELGAGNIVIDPEAFYDPDSQRYFAMATEFVSSSQNFVLLGISDDTDPNGNWHKYRIPVSGFAFGFFDSPNFTVSSDVVYVTGDYLSPPVSHLILAIEKAPLLTGSDPLMEGLVRTNERSGGLPQQFGVTDAPQLIVETDALAASGTTIEIHAVLDPLGELELMSTTLSVPSYSQPENAPSLGTAQRVNTYDTRIWSSMQYGDALWATHHAGTGLVQQRWYEIALNGWPDSGELPTLVQSGVINPGVGVRSHFGTIWGDEQGNATVAFARSSFSEFVSIAATSRSAADPLGFMNPDVFIRESSDHPRGQETLLRWGDYADIVVDPVDPSVLWVTHEYATPESNWCTWIARVESTELSIISSQPSDGAIDARQPSDLDGANVTGWDTVELTFSGDPGVVSIEDFVVESTALAPAVAAVGQDGDVVSVTLDGPIPAGACTRLRHLPTSSSVRLGYLPGDVNGDGTSGPLDILAVIDHVNGAVLVEPHQCDIDRNGECGTLDILRVIDLLNGADAFDAWNSVMLPECPE
jgi:hypothetical protein